MRYTEQPISAVSVPSAKPWIYRLPVEPLPQRITWQCEPREACTVSPDPVDPRTVTLSAWSEHFPFMTIRYVLSSGEEEMQGAILVRVVAKDEPLTPPRPIRASSFPIRDQSPAHESSEIPPIQASAPFAHETGAPQRLVTKGEPPPSLTQFVITPQCHRLGIQVLSESGVPANEVLTIVRGRKYVIGRSSSSLSDQPDLVLDRHFASEDQIKLCSRNQATVFWQEQTVTVCCNGRQSLKAVAETGVLHELSNKYDWAPGEVLCFPGAVRLQLIQC